MTRACCNRRAYDVPVSTAVIDIGTNTLLLLIVDDHARRIVDLCRFGRLGKGLDASGNLAGDAIAKSLDICREYRRVMDDHGVTAPVVIATQALREAKNGRAFVEPAQDILGAPIEVIGGEREAELAFVSVAHSLTELAGKPYVVVDVGGGSTEFIATDGARVVSAVSVPIGAVRLTERHLAHDPPTVSEIAALDADIAAHLAKLELPTGVPLVGTAGTATTIAAIALGLHAYDPDKVTGLHLPPSQIAELRARMLAMTTAERRATAGVEPQRADVIAAGIAIYASALARMQAPVMIACDRGIRWGLAYERCGAAR
jgi:exopolyphosphatase/guanosine-5'-triphosphate,3'-diphosphate pyrophosphatase